MAREISRLYAIEFKRTEISLSRHQRGNDSWFKAVSRPFQSPRAFRRKGRRFFFPRVAA